MNLFQSIYCITFDSINSSDTIDIIKLTGIQSFFGYQVYDIPKFSMIPRYSESTLHEISLHFVQVYCSLWCCPVNDFLQVSEWITSKYFNHSLFSYTAVHKRDLEGACDLYMMNMNQSNFDPLDLPMMMIPTNHSDEQSYINNIYPLCTMPYEFIQAIQTLQNRSHQKVFLAHDGHGNISDYQLHQAIIGSEINDTIVKEKHIDGKDMDMMIAMYADLFVLNPKSTLSWQIFIIRACLGLTSVPRLFDTDLYMRRLPDHTRAKHPSYLWINWRSIEAAGRYLRIQLGKELGTASLSQ
jgi:hypothetical protein